MLNFELIHPELLASLARSGHGTQILIADGNYPHNTGVPATATRVALNLRPGLLDVDQILEVLATAVPLEAAAVMSDDRGELAPAVVGYSRVLGDLPLTAYPRFDFYDAARSPNVAVIIASGDQRQYANLLLTIGVRTAGSGLDAEG